MTTHQDSQQEKEYIEKENKIKSNTNESCQNHISVIEIDRQIYCSWEFLTININK